MCMEEQRIKNNQDTPEENLVEGTVLADTKVYYKTLVIKKCDISTEVGHDWSDLAAAAVTQ